MTNPSNPPLLTFPCHFTLKVFGNVTTTFEQTVLKLVQKHVPETTSEHIQCRNSQKGNYCSLSITVFVHSQAQLDALYQELSHTPSILMTL